MNGKWGFGLIKVAEMFTACLAAFFFVETLYRDHIDLFLFL